MQKLLAYFATLNNWAKLLLCLLLTMFLGVVDYLTGDFSLMMFYIIPIFLAAWFIGHAASIAIAFLSGMALFSNSLLAAPAGTSLLSIKSWNALMEVFFLIITGYLLSNLKIELEQKKKRTQELESANLELEAFCHTVSHDLRKPLTIINGYCQAITDVCGNTLEEECKKYLREIYSGTLRMNELIDALLELSEATRGEVHRELFDLGRIAQTVAAELRLTDTERRCTFKIAEEIMVNGDKNLLVVVMENLLGNAWKYTGKQKEAIIEFGMKKVAGQAIYFVRDNGTGFEMSQAKTLFMPFQRLPGGNEFEGHGIGLATVQRIILHHGGKVWAEGEPGKGATFYFSL